MTSLVVVMNNKAAAVAADSAMTVTDGDGNTRVRKGVKKLFHLSEKQPVSAMIYGSAELMGQSWGPIMVAYRRRLGDRSFATVEEYALDFMRYLDEYQDLFTEDGQDRHYLQYLDTVFEWIIYNVNYIVAQEKQSPTPDGPKNMRDVVKIATSLVYSDVTAYPDETPRHTLPGFERSFGRDLLKKYRREVDTRIEQYFGEANIDNETRRRLQELSHLVVTRDFFPDFFPNTGVVFTGYGHDQLRPQMVAYTVGIAVNGRLRRRKSNLKQITDDEPIIIAPFAQDRMIHTFLTGMDEELHDYMVDQIVDLSIGVRDTTINQMPKLSTQQKQELTEKYPDDALVKLIHSFFDRLDQYQYEIHTHPVLLAIESLPERDLAKAASMLVQLNAFQHHVSMNVESVGGAIDVALLTTERFKWIDSQDHV